MNYAMPVVAQKVESEIRSRPLAEPPRNPVTTGRAANEDVAGAAEHIRPVEPMLLVYQERAETFRLVFAALGRGFRALTRSFAR